MPLNSLGGYKYGKIGFPVASGFPGLGPVAPREGSAWFLGGRESSNVPNEPAQRSLGTPIRAD